MLRRKARRGPGADHAVDDPLDAAQERRVRAVLALGGVPQADLPDGARCSAWIRRTAGAR